MRENLQVQIKIAVTIGILEYKNILRSKTTTAMDVTVKFAFNIFIL